MNSDVVIQAENISKQYRLGVINHGTLYRDLQSWWARWRGQPDPNAELVDARGIRESKARIVNDRFYALDDVSFSVNQGDIIGIVGRNGAGKSTLLKVISRITAPTTGRIRLKGRVASLLEVGTGFHPELTGRENVYLNGAILGMTRREVGSKFEQIVEFAEIGEFIDTPVKRYSSGMYVRLAFSVAAHLDPEILLVDEVLAVGDINFQKKCLGRMQEIGKDGRTILFVSHNVSAVKQMCNKGLLLNDGRSVRVGPTSDIISEYVDHFNDNRAAEYVRDTEPNPSSVAILRVAVSNASGIVASQIELTEDFSVEIDYLLGERLSGLSVGVQIILDDGLLTVISLSDPEFAPERLEARAVGHYKARVRIPKKILNTGRYRIRAGISSRFSIYDVVENVTFEVVDNVGIVQFMGWDRKGSLLGLQLPWDVARS
jgi:lipopolysaccharide transport system ATP-binding protein